MYQYSQLKSKYAGKIADKACGSKSKKYCEVKTYAERSEAKKFKFKKINILFILIITVKFFPCV